MTLGGGNRVHVQITGDRKDLDKDLKGAGQQIDKFGKKADRSLRATAGKIQAGIAVAAFATFRLMKGAVDRAEEMNSAYAITEQVIKQTGGAANVTAEEMKNLARQQSILTGIDKALITESNNILLTFKNIRNEVGEGNDVFKQASGLILDMATTMGTDAKSGAIQLGKALNDPILGVSALNRVGIQFTETQKEQIANFQESGDLMSAQKIILAELEGQLGGTAEAAADDSAKIARSFDEITESVGGALLPALALLAQKLPVLFGQISRLQELSQIFDLDVGSVELTGKAIDDLGKSFRILGSTWVSMNPMQASFVDGINEILDESKLTSEALLDLGFDAEVLQKRFGLVGIQAEELADIIRLRLVNQAFGATREPLQNFGQGLTDIQKAFGLTRERAEALRLGVGNADKAMLLMAQRGGRQAREALLRIKAAAKTAVPGVREMEDAIDAVNSAMLASANPIFRAVRAYGNYSRTLKQVDEDGKRSAEEQLLLSEATLEAQAALASLGEAELTRGLQAIADSLGISVGAARDFLVELGLLDGTTVNLLFTASMDPADRALLEMAGRGGSGEAIPGAGEPAVTETGRALIEATTGVSGAPAITVQEMNVTINDDLRDPAAGRRFVEQLVGDIEDYTNERLR